MNSLSEVRGHAKASKADLSRSLLLSICRLNLGKRYVLLKHYTPQFSLFSYKTPPGVLWALFHSGVVS